jgi:hypothetical protein
MTSKKKIIRKKSKKISRRRKSFGGVTFWKYCGRNKKGERMCCRYRQNPGNELYPSTSKRTGFIMRDRWVPCSEVE